MFKRSTCLSNSAPSFVLCFSIKILLSTSSAMGPKADAKADAKPKAKTENRQGRALGSGTVSGARRARRLAEFGPPTGVPKNQADAPALKKAFGSFVKYFNFFPHMSNHYLIFHLFIIC